MPEYILIGGMITPRFQFGYWLGTLWLLFAIGFSGFPEEIRLESAGARFGASITSESKRFSSVEATCNFSLPWKWDLGKDWWMKSRLDSSAGWLGGHGESGAMVAVGPTLTLAKEGCPVFLEGGISPAGISNDAYGKIDFGTHFQLASHIGLHWDFAAHWRLGVRFQHMSNGGVGHHNPGLNLSMASMSYRF